MAKAPAAIKNKALRALARPAARADRGAAGGQRARPGARPRRRFARAHGGSAKTHPQVLETCAQGCEQLAAMPDVIGEIIGLQQQPSGIRVGQMRVPIGVFGMIFESRPNVTIEAASLSIKSGNACILRGGPRPSTPTRRWRGWCSRRWKRPVCPRTPCNWCKPPTAPPWATSSPCPSLWT